MTLSFVVLAGTQKSECEYGMTKSCPEKQICVNSYDQVAKCIPRFESKLLTLNFPYAGGVQVTCDQGVLSPAGESHTWWNTAYAVDLQSDRSVKDVSIFSGGKGKVIAFNDCKTENDKCGGGFGNSVKVLMDDGYFIFYAHLKQALVKTGDVVQVGQKIGLEGATGWTGKDNRHLHLSVHFDWRDEGFDHWKQVGFVPSSVPFKISMCIGKCASNCSETEFDVRTLECRRTSKQVPTLCAK